MKRIVLGILILGAIGAASPAAKAACVAVGPYDRASVTFTDANGTVTIYGEEFGNFATGPIVGCSDATAGPEAKPRGMMSITVNGVERCHRTDATSRLTADPFGFGGGVHNTHNDEDGHPVPDGVCGADVSWNELLGTPSAGVEDVGVGTGGVYVGRRKAAPVTGSYWLDGGEPSAIPAESGPAPVALPVGSRGWFNRGLRIALS
jgi:hypothetical protein